MLKRKVNSIKKSFLKRTGFLKQKPVSQEMKDERKAQSEKDWQFYEKIWANRKHDCEVHEGYKFLGYQINKCFFDHLLEKSKYPQFRYEEQNIALVCQECHCKKTAGHPTFKHVEAIRKAKELLVIS